MLPQDVTEESVVSASDNTSVRQMILGQIWMTIIFIF